MDNSSMKRIKELKEKNTRLKKMYADEKLKAKIVSETLEKKWWSNLNAKRWHSERQRIEAYPYDWPARPSESP